MCLSNYNVQKETKVLQAGFESQIFEFLLQINTGFHKCNQVSPEAISLVDLLHKSGLLDKLNIINL
jgi:hypothetical protein